MREIDFENYFYVRTCDLDKVLNIIMEESRDRDFQTEVGYNSIYGDKLCKIIPNKFEFWKFRKALKAAKIKTYEAWLDVGLKYLLENPKVFSRERKVAIIDIENDGSLDCVNTPKTITSICLYDYMLDQYNIWILNNPNKDKIENRKKQNEVLRIFDSEKTMMQDFCDVFRESNFDICGGWNSNNFDWPYIINRLKVLGINPDELSNFGEVSCRAFWGGRESGLKLAGRVYGNMQRFYCEISGVELIDFILVLKKNTCYFKQPASFSLESVADFYLDIKKLVNVGYHAWKTDINNFINYNIRDVELVEKIVNKFKLIDFLMVIQTEMSPIPLGNATHNSVVLLHYIKHHFKNIIIPDNPGFIDIGVNGNTHIVDLSTSRVRIKAAHVISPRAGIHENVSVFDFSSLYPSIFRTFNICPSTINDDKCGVKIDDIVMWHVTNSKKCNPKSDSPPEDEAISFIKYFKQDVKGIYPTILENLTIGRNKYKYKLPELEKKYGKDSSEYLLTLYNSDVRKQINNSLYGCNAFNKFPIFNPWVGAAITSISRKCIMKMEDWLNNVYHYKVITGDTDSLMVEHPKYVDPKQLAKELNDKLKEWILEDFTVNPKFYCMELEYEKTYKTFVMTNAKKKYYGILSDDSFQAKGFDLIQHVLSDDVKEMIKKIYIMLMEKKEMSVIRKEISNMKKEFYKLNYADISKQLKIAKNLDEYNNNIQHIRAAKYSNKYLGTNFNGGSVGKLLFISETSNSVKYPKTDVLLLDENTALPKELKIDYDILWEKLFLDKIKLLEDIKEMKIVKLLNVNTTLDDFEQHNTK